MSEDIKSKKASTFLRLKPDHQTIIKLEKLMTLANELGVSLDFNHPCSVIITDRDRNPHLPQLRLYNFDSQIIDPIKCFPFEDDYKIIYDNPAYLDYVKKEKEAYEETVRQRVVEKERVAAEQKMIRELEANKQKEIRERALYEALKTKFEKQDEGK